LVGTDPPYFNGTEDKMLLAHNALVQNINQGLNSVKRNVKSHEECVMLICWSVNILASA